MNSFDPKSMKSPQIDEGANAVGDETGKLAPSEELMLRVEQIFEEAVELCKWMYNE